MPKVKPSKTELARFKVMAVLGMSPNAIGRRTRRDPKTVRKYLGSPELESPDVLMLVETIRKNELTDLHILGAKGRRRLHELLDAGKMRAIETMAVVDRTFHQRRLLEDKSTENVSHRSVLMEIVLAKKKISERIKTLDTEKERRRAVDTSRANNHE